MPDSVYVYAIAVILLVMIPFVPKLVVLRIRLLRFMRFNALADWHERHLIGFTIALRFILTWMAVILIIGGIVYP